MRPVLISTICIMATLALSGCKIVQDPDPAQTAADQSDEVRMLARAKEIWQPKLLPMVK